MHTPSRREFLKSTVTAACSAGLSVGGFTELVAASPASCSPLAAPPRRTFADQKGCSPRNAAGKLNYADRMKMARDVGFEVIQAPTTPDEHEAEEIKKAADGANVRIDSVMNMDHWKYPLSSSDAAAVDKSLAGMRSLCTTPSSGSDAVLLVPRSSIPQTSYRDAWSRSQTQIRKLLPLAEELKIVIAIEEVWNKFLLSPLENGEIHRRISKPVDPSVVRRWKCPALRLSAGLDSHAGESISKVHLKDFKRKESGYEWANLGDGDVDWEAVA